jgi:hypothetical protein
MAYDDSKTIDISSSSAPEANDARAALLAERARAMAEIERRARFPEDDVAIIRSSLPTERIAVPRDAARLAGATQEIGQRNTARDSALVAIGFMIGCSITTIVVALLQ